MEFNEAEIKNAVVGYNSNGIFSSAEYCNDLNQIDYIYPSGHGSFEGVLQFRCRAKQKGHKYPPLDCYFLTDLGEKYVLRLWHNFKTKYRPWDSGPDFTFGKLEGRRYLCTYEPFPNGTTKWLSAIEIENVE